MTTAMPRRRPIPHLRGFTWGFADQGLSSLTNFGLSLLAGRLLGPSGLGVVFVAFSVYLVMFGLQRSLLSQPLVAVTASHKPRRRRHLLRLGLTVVGTGGLVVSGIVAFAGVAIGGSVGHGLVLLSPWLVPLLVQDYWRSVLFLEERGGAATLNDGLWLAVMLVVAPLVWLAPSTWALIAWWASGAAAGAALGIVQLRVLPAGIHAAWSWWRTEVWPVGRWLAGSTVVYSTTTYAATFALAGLLGSRDLGGLQAVTVVFAPLSLLGAAFTLPALPALSAATATSPRRARGLALKVSFTTTALVAVYIALVLLSGTRVLGFVFGRSFEPFQSLVLPVGVGQLLSAAAGGLELLMVAQRRGRAVLLSGGIGQVAALGLAVAWAAAYGLKGAAWGFAAGYAIRTLARAWFAFPLREARASEPTRRVTFHAFAYAVSSSIVYRTVRHGVGWATRPIRKVGIGLDLMLRKDLTGPLPDFPADIPVEIAIASRAEVAEQVPRLHRWNHDSIRTYFLRKVDAGMTCFFARSGPTVVGYNCILFRPAVSDNAFVALRPGEVWGTDAFTAHAWRGRKIHTALLNRMLQHAQQHGCTTAYTLTRVANRASRKTHHRLGWQSTCLLLHLRVGDRVIRLALVGSARPLVNLTRNGSPRAVRSQAA